NARSSATGIPTFNCTHPACRCTTVVASDFSTGRVLAQAHGRTQDTPVGMFRSDSRKPARLSCQSSSVVGRLAPLARPSMGRVSGAPPRTVLQACTTDHARMHDLAFLHD